MASGLPVVAAGAGGTLSLVEDGASGVLTAPDSAEQSADGIERLIEDPDLRRAMAARGLEIAARHDWDAINGVVLERYLVVVEAAWTKMAA